MAILKAESIIQWYGENESALSRLCDHLEGRIQTLLTDADISFVTVDSRLKSIDSMREKIVRKNYQAIDELTDIIGVRVILYLEPDTHRADEIIDRVFDIHDAFSVNKSDELSDNQVGYRSNHHICSLGADADGLSRFEDWRDFKFEIQIRTILQHAWAEIEHDRNYKFPGDIPSRHRRKFNLIAGTLELMDSAFADLVTDLQAFAADEASNRAKPKDSEPITSATLQRLLESIPGLSIEVYPKHIIATPLEGELSRFGIFSIGDLEELLSEEFIACVNRANLSTNSWGLLRSVMMYADMETYFAKAWNHRFRALGYWHRQMLDEKYGEAQVEAVLKRHGLKT